MTIGTDNFESLIVKKVWSGLPSVLSLPAAVETQCLVHWSFNSTLQLINGISGDLQKVPRYFNGTANV